MVDIRVSKSQGGQPVPFGGTIEETLAKGQDPFLTRYAKNLAKQCSWSQGYAHMGVLDSYLFGGLSGLCGLNINGFESFCRIVEQGPYEREEDAPSISWDTAEITKVHEFHNNQLGGRICHYPVPLRRARREGVMALQYCKSGGVWHIGPDVHGHSYEDQTIIGLQTFTTLQGSTVHHHQSSASVDTYQMRSSSTTQTTDYSAPPTQLIQVFETITNREQYAYSCTSYRAPSAPCGRYASDQSRIALSDQQFYSDG
jgi:hypothetical protein